MLRVNKSLLIFITLLIGCYLLTWYMQSHLLLKGDVVWQMHMSRLLLQGGNYVTDFFEINPPLSIYLYIPAIFLQNIFFVNDMIAMRIYMFALTAISLLVCALLAKKIFPDTKTTYIFLFSLAVIYLILPGSEFAQRECMLLYFTMPYFLLVCYRLQKKELSITSSALIGLAAGIGFAIKPFFLTAPLLVEIYYLFKKKTLTAWLRPEIISIALFMVFYLLLIIIRHPDYLTIVVPIASRFYYKFYTYTWQGMFLHEYIFFMVFTVILARLFSTPAYRQFTNVFSIVLIGFLFSYLMQKIAWYYHILPPLSLAIVLGFFVIARLMDSKERLGKSMAINLILSVMIFFYPAYLIGDYYYLMTQQYNVLQPMISDLRQHENNRYTYFFTSESACMVSVLDHAGVKISSRLQFLTFAKRYLYPGADKLNLQEKKDEQFFINMLVEDLNKNKPDRIYVDKTNYAIFHSGAILNVDYLAVLLRYPEFQKTWQAYHFLKSVKYGALYRFDVYERSHIAT